MRFVGLTDGLTTLNSVDNEVAPIYFVHYE